MSNRFEGWYFKHQHQGKTLALIPGRCREHAFIQVVTDDRAYNAIYPLADYHHQQEEQLEIAGNLFSRDGVRLDIHDNGIDLSGRIDYGQLTPLRSDIMGPFRFFPMECRHTVVSMNHPLRGGLTLNGRKWDFDGGTGYIEGDSGRSFPDSYVWVQCNAFAEACAIMASVARIPFAGLKFWGSICAVCYDGREYRLATYRGARVKEMRRDRLQLEQGKLRLIVEIADAAGHNLPAPERGSMRRLVHEAPACRARFRLIDGHNLVFDAASDCASYEFVGRHT